MILATFIASHRRSLLFLLALAVASGVAAGFGLPVGLFPNTPFPRVAISIDAGERPIDQMAAVITRPLEQAVRSTPGVTDVRSTTSRGAADIKVSFGWGADMNLALQRVESALQRASAGLPAGVSFQVRRMDPTVFPVAAYSLSSERVGPVALRRYADLTLAPLLTAIPGVARVDSLGGGEGEFRVEVDPDQLRALGLSPDDIDHSLSAANVLEADGRLEDHGKLYLTLSDSRLTGLSDIANVTVRSPGGSLFRLGDIATVRLAQTPNWVRVTADGRDAVNVQIYQQPNGDTVRIVRDVATVFARSRATAPPGLRLSAWYDQSELIKRSASSLVEAIAVGAVLAALVLLLFLRNLGVTVVAVVVVPAVLALTTLALWLTGQSFNIMTLGGMAAAIGLIIDDAIVMIEHIERRVASDADDRPGATRAAAQEFLRPLWGSTAATILIFLPLAFLTGVTGAFFKALALTMAIALFASFLLAWLVVPVLMERLHAPAGPPAAWLARFSTSYRRALEHVAARPWISAVILPALAAAGALAFAVLPSGFMPRQDEGGFILDYINAPGASLSETDRLMRQIEEVLRATPEVATYSRRTGAQLGGDLTESNVGDFFVRLKPLPRRDIGAVMDEVREKVAQRTPGVDIDTAQLMEDLIGDLTAVPQPIEVKLYGEDSAQLRATAEGVAGMLGAVHGLAEIRDGVVVAGDALDIRIDPVRAALAGVTPADASRQVAAMVDGAVATQVQSGAVLTNVRVVAPADWRDRAGRVADLPIHAADGPVFPLSHIADVAPLRGQAEVTRENGRQMIAITARVEGRDMGSAAREVQRRLRAGGVLPAGVSFEMGGLFAEQQTAFAGLAAVFIAALAVVAVLLLFLYENFRIVAAIIAMPLAAACFVGVALFLAGVELNIMALMGLTMVVGIVTEVAIFYFTEFDRLVADGTPPGQALIEAGANRLRPIAMTTLAAILALTPLALGASMQKPLAIAIIAGLVAQGPLVLLVMPALYRLIGGEEVRRSVRG